MLAFSFYSILFVLAHSAKYNYKDHRSPAVRIKETVFVQQSQHGQSNTGFDWNTKQKDPHMKDSVDDRKSDTYNINTSFRQDDVRKRDKRDVKNENKFQPNVKSYKRTQKRSSESISHSDVVVHGIYPETDLKTPQVADQKSNDKHKHGSHNNDSDSDTVEESEAKNSTHDKLERFPVATFNFHHVGVPMVAALWVLMASLAKIGFHLNNKLSSIFPESCLLILLGVVVGIILYFAKAHGYELSTQIFFLVLLPPIILDAGYFMPSRAFFDNIGTILLFAVINTIFNTLLIGFSLWGFSVAGVFGVSMKLLHCLVFAALISAVDPVAVLAVFEEVKVNEILYIVVFGESLLNDAVTVVLYKMFEAYSEIGEEKLMAVDIVSGIFSFVVNGICATLIGVIFGFTSAFITRFTDHVRVIEPITVFLMGYLSYLAAEMFEFSGILACTFCGITMKKYVEANISEKSHTTIKYFMKMLASISETVIFLFLGLSVVTSSHHWDTAFILLTLLFCLVYRALGVAVFAGIVNRFRLCRLSGVDQFTMAYGGLRGAIAFSLAVLLHGEIFPQRQLIITATVVVVMFTVFIQQLCELIVILRMGVTIKPLVNLLHVRRSDKHKPTLSEWINSKLSDHMLAGIEDITGYHGHHQWRERFQFIDNKYLKPLLIKEKHKKQRGVSLLNLNKKLNEKDVRDFMASQTSYEGKPQHSLSSANSVLRMMLEQAPDTQHLWAPMPSSERTRLQGQDNPAVTFHVGDEDVSVNVESPTSDDSLLEDQLSTEDKLVQQSMLQPRKQYARYRRHTLATEEDISPFHHTERLHLRRAVDLHNRRYSRQCQTRHHSEPEDNSGSNEPQEGKVKKNVSFADQRVHLEPYGHDADLVEAAAKSFEPESEVKFTLASDSDSEMNSGRHESDGSGEETEQAPVEPTAVEVSLPWKRNTGRPPISSSFTHSLPDDDEPQMYQPPSWVDNENYNTVPEPLPHPAEPIDKALCASCLYNHKSNASDSAMHSGCECSVSITEQVDDILPPPWKCHNQVNCDSDNGNLCNNSQCDPMCEAIKHNYHRNIFPAKANAEYGLPPLPWRYEMAPIRSPSASNEVDVSSSIRPQFSSHSLRLSEAESRHSEHLHMHHMHVIDLPSHHSCPLFDLELPMDDEQDTLDRVSAWLLNTDIHDSTLIGSPESVQPLVKPDSTCANNL